MPLLALMATTTATGVLAADPEPSTVPYSISGSGPFNAPQPLLLDYPGSSGGAVHPSVMDFYPGTWNGHRYWMICTPFGNGGVAGGPSAPEDPAVFVSSDGYRWTAPAGLTNPISTTTLQASLPPYYGGGLNTDSEFCFDPTTQTVHAWWRAVVGTPQLICWHSSSVDGITWTPPDVAFVDDSGFWVCPTVVRMADDDWRMWMYVGGALMLKRAGSPTGPWSASELCTGHGGWHGDVIYHEGEFWAMTDGKVARSTGGVAWRTAQVPALAGRLDMWDSAIYRCTIAPHPDGHRMRVWYGRNGSSDSNWQIGYTLVPKSAWPD